MLRNKIKKHHKTIKNWFVYIILICNLVNMITTPLQIESIYRVA